MTVSGVRYYTSNDVQMNSIHFRGLLRRTRSRQGPQVEHRWPNAVHLNWTTSTPTLRCCYCCRMITIQSAAGCPHRLAEDGRDGKASAAGGSRNSQRD